MQKTLPDGSCRSFVYRFGSKPGGGIHLMIRIMRITLIQATIAMTLCGIAFASENYGQGLLDKEVTVKFEDATLQKILSGIEKQAHVKFAYSANIVDLKDKVTLEVSARKLRDVLEELLRPRGIQYSEESDYIVLTQVREGDGSQENNDPQATQQPVKAAISVSGTITDANGDALAGVNVVEKGTTNGTFSDAAGKYTVEVGENATLVFSFIGYKSFEVAVNARIVIDVVIEEDVATLGEVVVNAGYWTVKEKEKTGNIARVEGKVFEHQQVSNPLQALQGRMPGVNIQQQNGMPGGGFKIQIRGQNSLRLDANNPLYIIDGVPYTATSISVNNSPLNQSPSPLSTINPYDIESIEVLKDADATAIYGSRGANGVVLVTTKKATGSTKFDLTISQGFSNVANRMSLLNTDQYLQMRMEGFANDNLAPGVADYDVNGAWGENYKTRYTDWQEVLLGGTAKSTNVNGAISGGSRNTNYMISGGYYRESTVFPGDMYYGKGSGKVNINHTSNDQKFNLSLTSTLVVENNHLTNANFPSLISTLAPNSPELYDSTGNLNWQNGTWTNPLGRLKSKNEHKNNNIISNLVLSYHVLPDLQLKASVGYNILQSNSLTTIPISSQSPFGSVSPTGSASFGKSTGNTWIVEPQAEYNKKVGNSAFRVLVGGTLQENIGDYLITTINGVTDDALLESIASAPQGGVSSTNSYNQYKYAAIFGRFNYTFNSKYIVNLTARRDGSSRFGPDRQFGNFGAAGLAWIFSEENFIKGALPFLSFGKIRSSYGTTGSDQIANYGFMDTYGPYDPAFSQYLGQTSIVPSGLANPNYAWEVNKKWEVGLETGFFKDRVLFTTSYYSNRSSNQLVGLPLPGTTGFASIQYNLPATVQNTGWEFELNTINISRGAIQWSTGFNITIPKTKLVEYPNIEDSPYAKTYAVGKPLDMIWGFSYLGINPQTGLYQFKDADQNGSISTTTDQQQVVFTGTNLYGGLQNSITYKSFKLDFFFQFVMDRQSLSYRAAFSMPGVMGNQPIEVMSRWQSPGDNTSVQRFSTQYNALSSQTYWNSSNAAYTDASFIKLRNVNLSWKLPVGAMTKMLKSALIYVQAQNLLTITKYKGLDPESGSIALPPLRTISFGVQVSL